MSDLPVDEFRARYPHGVLAEQEGGVPNEVVSWEGATHVCRKHREHERVCRDVLAEPMHRWVEPHGDLTACGIRWWNGTRGDEPVTCPTCITAPDAPADDLAAQIAHALTCTRCRMGWTCGGVGEDDYAAAERILPLLAAVRAEHGERIAGLILNAPAPAGISDNSVEFYGEALTACADIARDASEVER